MPLGSTMMADLGEGFKLPITRRGLFAKDDFFKGFQQDYSQAVGDVLDKWRSRSSLADRFASYKRLRERDHSDDSQAATVSDTPGSHIIVIDMNEYANGQITVETSGFSAVVNAKIGQRTYHRRFPLPQDTIIDGVVADLSDDNILTVTAPRKGKGGVTNQTSEGRRNGTASISSTRQSSTSTSVEDQIIPTDSSISSTERVIPTMREGASTSSTSSSTSHNVKTQQMESTSTRRGSSTRVVPLNFEEESSTLQRTSTAGERIIPTIRETDARSSMQYGNASSFNRVLPIKRRGRFFQDTTFENAWRDFESAIDDMVARRGSTAGQSGEDDRFKAYSNLRDVVQADDSQAATLTKEGNQYKIVMDVKEFADAHLDVKAVTGSVTVIGQKGSRSFERRFSLPGLSQPENVAAALSTDGVLTITAPM